MNRAQRVIEFIEQRPMRWIRATEFEPIGGRQAWRTAISEARSILRPKGADIQNRTRTMREHSAGCPALQAWDVPNACKCGKPVTWTLSEYRYKPPVPASLFDMVS